VEEFRRRFAKLGDHARIVEYSVPIEIRPKNFEQRGALTRRAPAIRDPIDGAGKRTA